MSRILIIGYGNPMRGDDGLGQAAAERIKALVHDEQVEIIVRHQMGVELLEKLRDAELALFIDAHVGDVPGDIKQEEIAPDTAPPGSFSHHIRPEVLLGCVQALYNRHPETVVYSIAAQSFDHGEELSPAVEAALPGLISMVLARIDAFQAGNGR